jgi:hypothetical protein
MAASLAGCQSAEVNDHRECSALGAKPGSAVYEDCIRYNQRIRASQPAPKPRWPSESADRLSQGLMQMGAEHDRRNRVIHCNSQRFGNQVNTTCY